MSYHPHNPPDDLLDQAVEALRATPIPDGPREGLIEQALTRLGASSSAQVYLPEKAPASLRLFTRLAVAATFLVGLSGLIFWLARPSPSFGQVVDRIRQVQAVTFKTTITLSAGGKEERTDADVLIVEPARMRQSLRGNGAITIIDFKAGKALMLEPRYQTAMMGDMGAVPVGQRVPDILADLKQAEQNAGRAIGEKQIAGHKARGFSITRPGNPMTIWVDVQTRLPVEIEMAMQVGGSPQMRISMSDFRWDPQVDERLLALVPPEGYAIRRTLLATGPLTEQDIKEALKALTRINAPPLSPGVSMAPSLAQVVIDVGNQVSDTVQFKQLQASLIEFMSVMGRGVAFGQPGETPDDATRASTRPIR